MSANFRPIARTALLTTGGILLGTALSLTNVPRAIAAQFSDVIVRNTAANPVPVTVQGAASVTGGVEITNTAPIPATLQPDNLTHMRQHASDHVTLFTIFAGTYRRLTSTGGQEANWQVPPGKVFVVTDVEWVRTGSNLSPGLVQFRLAAVGPGSSGQAEYQFFTHWDGTGLSVHGEHHQTGGFVVPSGWTLSANLNNDVFETYVFGYLASDQ